MATVPRHRLRSLLGAVVAGLCLALSGCGGSDDGTATELSSTEHNDADVQFATDMIQHHAQALAMVDLTRGRPLDPEVKRLAEDIRAAQGPEIETMVGWLTEWGEEVPDTMRDHSHAGHDMGDMDDDMPGMMTSEEMAALEGASDAEFQDLWLQMMIEHHEGAVAMAKEELAGGRHPQAKTMAQAIIDGQTAEIAQMRKLLKV